MDEAAFKLVPANGEPRLLQKSRTWLQSRRYTQVQRKDRNQNKMKVPGLYENEDGEEKRGKKITNEWVIWI